MQLNLTNQALEAVFMTAEPFTLEASDALQATYQENTMGFLPALDHIPHNDLRRMAIEVKNYTERCYRVTRRLQDIQPIPSNLYIAAFGL